MSSQSQKQTLHRNSLLGMSICTAFQHTAFFFFLLWWFAGKCLISMLTLRLGCGNIYQTCFSPSLWQDRWFQRQVEGKCVHWQCFEENTENSWPAQCASQKQDSRNIAEPISKRIVNGLEEVSSFKCTNGAWCTSPRFQWTWRPRIFPHPYDPNIGVCREN